MAGFAARAGTVRALGDDSSFGGRVVVEPLDADAVLLRVSNRLQRGVSQGARSSPHTRRLVGCQRLGPVLEGPLLGDGEIGEVVLFWSEARCPGWLGLVRTSTRLPLGEFLLEGAFLSQPTRRSGAGPRTLCGLR